MTDCPIITFEGQLWRLLNKGAEHEGKTWCHLASTTRFLQQRNGQVPIQALVQVDNDQLPTS